MAFKIQFVRRSNWRLWTNRQLVSILLLVWCSGCLPWRFNTSPGASGVVVDAERHAPLSGAEVVVSQLIYPPPSAEAAFTNSRPPIVTTDAQGRFSIPAERRWDIFVIPIDAFPRFGMLVVKHEGYEAVTLPFWSRSVEDVGHVVMKPVNK
ncbi:MAG TPA: carboxypeptidase-like regulatory domain-containing protein [Candidatus Limnocylindrales bacterium]|jgi:hypothetical protein|nr:carboxypeptidase-like regulatory domain-containing protein [Candidatus Limnocylindrales bacterium]